MNGFWKAAAWLLALTVTLGTLAGCAAQKPEDTSPQPSETVGSSAPLTEPSQPKDSQPGEPGSPETDPDETAYTWDIEVVFPELDPEHGLFEDPDVVLTLTAPGLEDWAAEYRDQSVCFTPVSAEAELKIPDPDSRLVDQSDPTYQWLLDDEGYGYSYTLEVTEPLTEGDYAAHGRMVIRLIEEYHWDITVIYENGAKGEYLFLNPGFEEWDPRYTRQSLTFTPDSNTATMRIMDPSSWIVDNTQSWYNWVVTDVNDEGGRITYQVVQPLEERNFADHGVLEIHISLP